MRRSFLFLASFLLACGKGDTPPPADQSGSPGGTPVATSADPRAAIFTSKGCPQCHSISGLGIKSPAEVGPDLTLAAEDVKNRFSVPLEEFLHNPTGTMQLVLSSQIQLSPAERDSVIAILNQLYREHQASQGR